MEDYIQIGSVITVYEMAHSPYCIPITFALRALDTPFERVEVPNHDRSSVIRASSGTYYQVPLLVHNGRFVAESTPTSLDIAHYVDQTWGQGRLFPAVIGGIHTIAIDFIEDQVEGISFKLVDPPYLRDMADPVARLMTIRHKERKFGRGCVDQWQADAPSLRIALEGLLERFNQTLHHHPFLFGQQPVYADFALCGILGNYTFRDYNRLPDGQIALASWWDRMQAFRFS